MNAIAACCDCRRFATGRSRDRMSPRLTSDAPPDMVAHVVLRSQAAPHRDERCNTNSGSEIMNKAEFLTTSKPPFAERYDNFIGGKWVAPGRRQIFRQRLAGDRPGGLQDRALRRAGRRSSARCRACGQGRLGPHQRRRTRADPQPDRRPDGSRISSARGRRNLGQWQADPRDPRRRPAAGDRSFPLFRRRDARARKAASPRSITTPSPITSTSRSASSARSFRGISRC